MTGTISGVGDVPTVVDNMFKQRLIERKLVGISFEPTTQNVSTNGVITFGGVDPNRFIGLLTYT